MTRPSLSLNWYEPGPSGMVPAGGRWNMLRPWYRYRKRYHDGMTAASRVNQARRAAGFPSASSPGGRASLSRPSPASSGASRYPGPTRSIGCWRRAASSCGWRPGQGRRRRPEPDPGVARHVTGRAAASGDGLRPHDRPVAARQAGRARRTVNPVFDPTLAMRVLNRHEVEYVLIGGLAGELLGAPLAPTTSTSATAERPRTWIGWRTPCGSSTPSSASPGLTRTCPSSSTDARSPPATPSPS